jgi:hypothetical protein
MHLLIKGAGADLTSARTQNDAIGRNAQQRYYARHWILAVFKMATLGGLGVWALVDVNLWIVGGIYGTPGCPGGSKNKWAY